MVGGGLSAAGGHLLDPADRRWPGRWWEPTTGRSRRSWRPRSDPRPDWWARWCRHDGRSRDPGCAETWGSPLRKQPGPLAHSWVAIHPRTVVLATAAVALFFQTQQSPKLALPAVLVGLALVCLVLISRVDSVAGDPHVLAHLLAAAPGRHRSQLRPRPLAEGGRDGPDRPALPRERALALLGGTRASRIGFAALLAIHTVLLLVDFEVHLQIMDVQVFLDEGSTPSYRARTPTPSTFTNVFDAEHTDLTTGPASRRAGGSSTGPPPPHDPAPRHPGRLLGEVRFVHLDACSPPPRSIRHLAIRPDGPGHARAAPSAPVSRVVVNADGSSCCSDCSSRSRCGRCRAAAPGWNGIRTGAAGPPSSTWWLLAPSERAGAGARPRPEVGRGGRGDGPGGGRAVPRVEPVGLACRWSGGSSSRALPGRRHVAPAGSGGRVRGPSRLVRRRAVAGPGLPGLGPGGLAHPSRPHRAGPGDGPEPAADRAVLQAGVPELLRLHRHGAGAGGDHVAAGRPGGLGPPARRCPRDRAARGTSSRRGSRSRRRSQPRPQGDEVGATPPTIATSSVGPAQDRGPGHPPREEQRAAGRRCRHEVRLVDLVPAAGPLDHDSLRRRHEGLRRRRRDRLVVATG